MSRRSGAGLLGLYLLLRGLLLLEPGYQDDLTAYRRWALAASEHGVAQVYRESDMDYPPLYAYVLGPLGDAYRALSPGAGTKRGGNHAVFTALVKLPPLAFDLAIAWLLYAIGARRDDGKALVWRVLLPGAYLANPAVVFDSGYWGHPDSVFAFFVLAAFLAVAARRVTAAFLLLTLGTLMKPLGAPFFPLLAFLALLQAGLVPTLVGIVAAAAAAAAVFLPFALAGELAFVLERVVLDIDRMPFTSVNAHNVWWALGAWRNADAPLVGPLSATHVGLLLFGAAYLAILAVAWRTSRRPGGLGPETAAALAAGVGFSFFMLSTHMHENHLFVVLPLLAVVLPASGPARVFFVLASASVFLNLLLHDPLVPGLWPLSLGGATEIARPSHGRTFYLAELWAVRLSTLFNILVFAGFLRELLRRGRPLGLVQTGLGSDDKGPP